MFLGSFFDGFPLFGGSGGGSSSIEINIIGLGSSRQVATSEQKKVAFFDKYRHLDVELGRMVHSNSGGIGLLIKAYRKGNIKSQRLGKIMPTLVAAKDYRNRIAHSKDKWRSIKDPEQNYSTVLQIAREEVMKDKNHIAHQMARVMTRR